MSDELSLGDVAEPEQDIDKTPTQADTPKPVSSGVWAMPDPVFKKTSGYLPQAFNKQFDPVPQGNEDTTAQSPRPDLPMPVQTDDEATADVPDVGPQPDVLEDGLESTISAERSSPPQKKGIAGRIMMILLALIIVGLMAAVLAAAVWYVWPRPEGTIN